MSGLAARMSPQNANRPAIATPGAARALAQAAPTGPRSPPRYRLVALVAVIALPDEEPRAAPGPPGYLPTRRARSGHSVPLSRGEHALDMQRRVGDPQLTREPYLATVRNPYSLPLRDPLTVSGATQMTSGSPR